MMKVVFFIPEMGCGGSERVCSILASYYAEKNYSVFIVTLDGGRSFYKLPESVTLIGLNMLKESRNVWEALTGNINRIRQLSSLIRDIQPDGCISFTTQANVLLVLAGKLCGEKAGKLIISERIFPPRDSIPPSWRVLRFFAYRLADHVVAQTEEVKNWLEKHTLAKEVRVIPNPVVVPVPSSSEAGVLPHHIPPLRKMKPKMKLLLSAGRLAAQKRFDILIKAFARISHLIPEWVLVILGEGRERARLEFLIEKYGMTEKIFLPGISGNMDRWYKRADLFAFSSGWEGLPNAVLEAMSYGLPVVAANCSGVRELIRNGRSGMIVRADDPLELSRVILLLAGDEELRRRIGEAARSSTDSYSLEKTAGMWEALLQSRHKVV